MQSKDVYLMCYEGDAEEKLFGYLKGRFCEQNKSFKPLPLNGFNSLVIFKRRYNQVFKATGLKKKKIGQKVHFVFFIDGDLEDTPAIVAFIKGEGHQYQLNNQNTESVLLRMAGINVVVDTLLPDFRKKSKAKFMEKFGKEAHQMKDSDFDRIITTELFEIHFPVLLEIFRS